MKLIAFSGKKQSGKDTAARFIHNNAYVLFPVDYQEPVDDLGIPTQFVKSSPYTTTLWIGKGMKDFCRDYLGVPHELLWGTDEQKNQLTHIRWEDLPHYQKITDRCCHLNNIVASKGLSQETIARLWVFPPTGYMTARELLQQVGEEMFLDMDPKVWTRMFKREVERHQKSGTDVALVGDLRKPEQVDAVHECGGIVIRLLRDPYEGKDRHISETALDPENYDYKNFDAVIDNRDRSIRWTHEQVIGVLASKGWVAPLRLCECCEGIDPSALDWCDE